MKGRPIQPSNEQPSQSHLPIGRIKYRQRFRENCYYFIKIKKFYLKLGIEIFQVYNSQQTDLNYDKVDSQKDENQQKESSGSSSSDESYQESNQQEQQISSYELSDNFIRNHILQNHIGELSEYQLPKPKKNYRIHDLWHNKKTYSKILRQLLLYQIIADVNSRIEDKSEQQFQKEIYIKIKTQIKFKQKLVVLPQSKKQLYKLKQILIKGQRLGILIKKESLPFKVNKLYNKYSNRLCFLQYEYENSIARVAENLNSEAAENSKLKTLKSTINDIYNNQDQERRIIIIGIQEWQINKDWEMVFLDLDSIVSSIRQYRAINDFGCRFISKLLVQNSKPIKINRKPKCFIEGYTQVLSEIQKQRNEDQYTIIKDLSQKRQGLYMIQGPPGTGKTETICNFASLQYTFLKQIKNIQQSIPRQLDDEPRSVSKDIENIEYKIRTSDVIMICAQSNAAVNNIARKLLTQKFIGRKKMPNILRLGHTQQYDQLLLSINLPHLVQKCLLKGRQKQFPKSSARLRWEKQLKYEVINKMKSEGKPESQIKKQQKELSDIIQQLVKIYEQMDNSENQYKRIQRYYLLTSQVVLSTLNTTGKRVFATFFGPKNKKNTYSGEQTILRLGVSKGQKKVKCLIIDQASQATQPSTLIPMMNNVKKIILVGDHKQLQPTIMSKNYRFTNYNRSMFERLVDAGFKPKLLSYQYRMISELKDFSNNYFYASKLKDGIKHYLPQFLSNIQTPSVFFDIAYGFEEKLKKSYSNEEEKNCIMALLKRLLKDKNLTIGVIAPYKSQVKDIQKSIQEQMNESVKQRCMVSTVDAFQGQEKDIIILTCVRGNPSRMIGFLRDQKRMNVSITRARYCLFVFGNCDTLYQNDLWKCYINYHYNKQSLVRIQREELADKIMQKYIPLPV